MSADGRSPTLSLELPSNSTVLHLKHQITSKHSRKPSVKDQRLIFSGKILDDSNTLEQVFQKSTSRSSFMIHLVLDTDRNATPSTPTNSESTTMPKVEQINQSNTTENTSYSSAYEQYIAQLNQYNQQLQQFMTNPINVPTGIPSQSQAYLQYCHTHYQMYANLLASQRNLGASINQQAAGAGSVNNESTSATNPPPPAAPAPAQANNNLNNNEFEQENDILGVLNMLAELFVLCSIIYFYSTFNRFLVVFIIFILLYLHCRGYLSIQRRRRAPAPAPAAPGNEPEQGQADEENQGDPVNNEPGNQRQTTNEEPAAIVTPTRIFITAISTFFSSLIPERPHRA